jgi:hypothetical protein
MMCMKYAYLIQFNLPHLTPNLENNIVTYALNTEGNSKGIRSRWVEKEAVSNAVRSLIKNDAWELVDRMKHVL